MRDIYIIGSGGFAKEVIWLIERINEHSLKWNIVGLLDDNNELHGKSIYGYQVLGSVDLINDSFIETYCICAIGNTKVRGSVISRISNSNVKFATLIDPSVIYSKSVNIGEGSIVCAGTILTVDINIGCHNIINLDCTVGHDSILDDFVTIYPSVNVSGNVYVGAYTELGTGTQIIQGMKISKYSIVGAGTVITKNVVNPSLVVGVPGIIKKEF